MVVVCLALVLFLERICFVSLLSAIHKFYTEIDKCGSRLMSLVSNFAKYQLWHQA